MLHALCPSPRGCCSLPRHALLKGSMATCLPDPTACPPALAEAAQQAQRAVWLLGATFNSLLGQPRWVKQAEAMGADAATQQALASLLLSCNLAVLAADVAADGGPSDAASLDDAERQVKALTLTLRTSCLAPAVGRHLRQEGSLVAAVGVAVDILGALPECCPADDAQQQFVRAWALSVQLLMELIKMAAEPSPGQPAVDLGSSGSNSNSSTAPSRQEWQQAAAVVLQQLPRLAAALLSAAGGCCAAEADKQQPPSRPLAGWLGNLSYALHLIMDRCGEAASENPAAWAQAAAAGLRLQPLLVQLDPMCRQLADSAAHNAAQTLAARLMAAIQPAVSRPLSAAQGAATAARSGTSYSVAASSSRASGSDASDASLAEATALLHTQLCRLVHYLAGGGALLSTIGWDWLLFVVDKAFSAALQPWLPADG